MRSCELVVFQRSEMPDWAELAAMPTVCLIALSDYLDSAVQEEMVRGCLSVGAIFFATYGDLADDMEERIDFVLENGNEAWLNVTTTSHQNESAEDVAHFIVNAAYLDDAHFRCLIIFDRDVANSDILLREVNKLCTRS